MTNRRAQKTIFATELDSSAVNYYVVAYRTAKRSDDSSGRMNRELCRKLTSHRFEYNR